MPEHDDRAAAVSALFEARGYLAAWCPHGMDSARAAEYRIAKEAREKINEALVVLQGTSRRWVTDA